MSRLDEFEIYTLCESLGINPNNNSTSQEILRAAEILRLTVDGQQHALDVARETAVPADDDREFRRQAEHVVVRKLLGVEPHQPISEVVGMLTELMRRAGDISDLHNQVPEAAREGSPKPPTMVMTPEERSQARPFQMRHSAEMQVALFRHPGHGNYYGVWDVLGSRALITMSTVDHAIRYLVGLASEDHGAALRHDLKRWVAERQPGDVDVPVLTPEMNAALALARQAQPPHRLIVGIHFVMPKLENEEGPTHE